MERLTDQTALALHRRRALRAPALFLREIIRDEVQERLALVNRSFTAPLVVTDFPALWPDFPCQAPQGDHLPLPGAAHDLIVLDSLLHWANDPIGLLVQARHALRPDGLLIAPLFGGQTLHQLRAALAEAEVALTGGLSPRVLPMGEIRDLGALLQRAGLALPVADSVTLEVTHPHVFALAADLRGMGEQNALAARLRRPTPRTLFLRTAQIMNDRFSDVDGKIRSTFEIVFLTGWAPSPDQPQPLRPGSARHHLSEVLARLAPSSVDGAPKITD
ncbi:methyltransferase domain-containing protein [Ketogulonicigenium vulgare]|uniref:methyltransferase domain-containing protein n=1 Tax=Ketogulonicigenium vulgare TaxID=92945 RepID=UPI002358896E|nr:methyltransferase domain-containing protein [Ketogulonicigenium vulgare]